MPPLSRPVPQKSPPNSLGVPSGPPHDFNGAMLACQVLFTEEKVLFIVSQSTHGVVSRLYPGLASPAVLDLPTILFQQSLLFGPLEI
jgi:hypothetical protein